MSPFTGEPFLPICYHSSMDAQVNLCDLVSPGVEVVTNNAPMGGYLTVVHGGRLDVDGYSCVTEPEANHDKVVRLCRMLAWEEQLKSRRTSGRRRLTTSR